MTLEEAEALVAPGSRGALVSGQGHTVPVASSPPNRPRHCGLLFLRICGYCGRQILGDGLKAHFRWAWAPRPQSPHHTWAHVGPQVSLSCL